MNKTILIGGAPATGKTSLAEQAASHFQIPWISTDQIREVLKAATTKEDHPDLFASFDSSDTEELVAREFKQCEVVWRGIFALINHVHPWDSCIIEGMAILPHLIARDLSGRTDIIPIFLLQNDLKVISRIVKERSNLPWIKTRTREQQERKVRQIALFNEKLKAEVQAYHHHHIEQDTREKSLRELVKIVK